MDYIKINKVTIQHICGYSTYIRGEDYYIKKKVLKLDTINGLGGDIGTTLITSLVQSTNQINKLYTTKISLVKNKRNEIKINGDCSCPVKYNCKHTVASLLKYIDEYQSNNTLPFKKQKISEIYNWIDNFYNKDSYVIDNIIQYHLIPLDMRRGRFLLRLFKSKILKKGGYGKIIPLNDLLVFNENNWPKYLTKFDKEMFLIFEAYKDSNYGYSHQFEIELKGEVGS